MVICELCGSANVENDEQCRVCGQALGTEPMAQPPLVTQVAAPVSFEPVQVPVAQQTAAPEPLPAPHQMPVIPPVEHDPASRTLQMSAFAEPVAAMTPPMLGGVEETAAAPVSEELTTSVPGFMQAGGRAAAAPEPVQLVSANDLPDWLKQIAEQDAAKAAAEAEAQAAHHDAPASIVKRALPGETHAAAPTTNWLSKSGPSSDSPDHWDTSEIASANWGTSDVSVQQAGGSEYPTIVPPTAFVPSSTEAYSTPKAKRKLSLGSRSAKQPKASRSSSQSSGTPLYRNQVVQLIVLIGLLVIFAGMLLR